jgi:hypothetical protein
VPNLKKPKLVPGSYRKPLGKAKATGKADPNQRIEVTVRVRSRSGVDWGARLIEMGSKPLSDRTYLTREELSAQRGADPLDLFKVEAFAHAQHLTVVERVLTELSALAASYRITCFTAVDNILDFKYVPEVFVRLDEMKADYRFFYEIKANITRQQLHTLYRGGVRRVQPGIETAKAHP